MISFFYPVLYSKFVCNKTNTSINIIFTTAKKKQMDRKENDRNLKITWSHRFKLSPAYLTVSFHLTDSAGHKITIQKPVVIQIDSISASVDIFPIGSLLLSSNRIAILLMNRKSIKSFCRLVLMNIEAFDLFKIMNWREGCCRNCSNTCKREMKRKRERVFYLLKLYKIRQVGLRDGCRDMRKFIFFFFNRSFQARR